MAKSVPFGYLGTHAQTIEFCCPPKYNKDMGLERKKAKFASCAIKCGPVSQASVIPAHAHTLCAGNVKIVTGNNV